MSAPRCHIFRLILAWLVVGVFWGMLLVKQALAERMVTDLSRHVINITSKFSGTELLIFGAIERGFPLKNKWQGIADKKDDYDIIVVVQSERHDIIVRRKERIGPIWANREFRTLKKIQGFYALTSTQPIKSILSQKKLSRMGLGLKQLKVAFKQQTSPREAAAFRNGFIRNMMAKKLYSQQEGTISLLDGILFRAILEFPVNMPVGNYQVDVYLIRDGEILLREQSPLEVDKAGLERFIFRAAHVYPATYGMMAILMALLSGWLGGFLSRKMSA